MNKYIDYYKRMPKGAKASVGFLFANVFQKAVMIIFTPIFTRVMTTEEFSKYAVFQSWEAIITVVATLNISSYATAKALVEIKSEKDNFIINAEVLTVILTGITFLVYMIGHSIYGFFDELPIPVMVALFCDIIFVAIFNFWSQLERFYVRYKALVIASMLIGIFSPAISFMLIYYADIIDLYKGWARIIGVVLVDGLLAIFILKISIKKKSCYISMKYWRYCLRYCIPLIPHFLAAAFLSKISQLFVDNYAGGNASGIFSLASSIALMMMVFNDAMTKTLVPWSYKKLAERKYEELNNPILLSLCIIGGLDIGLCLITPEVVKIFANEAYFEAIYLIPPMVGVCFFGFLYNAYTNIEYFYNETIYVSLGSVVAGGTIILLEMLTVPNYGMIAAAYSVLLSYCLYALIHYCFMMKTMKKHIPNVNIYDNKAILKASILFVVIILLFPHLYGFDYLRYLIIIGVLICLWYKRDKIINTIRQMYLYKKCDS